MVTFGGKVAIRCQSPLPKSQSEGSDEPNRGASIDDVAALWPSSHSFESKKEHRRGILELRTTRPLGKLRGLG